LTFDAGIYDTTLTEIFDLEAVWNEESTESKANTIVTLTPDNLIDAFGYASSTASIGDLVVSGSAADGSQIFADATHNDGIPVYVEEGIKLVEFDYNPDDIPTSRMIVTADAVKLTFSKAVSTELDAVEFAWGADLTGRKTDYTISGASVFVYTDQLATTGAPDLHYRVTSASDQLDTDTDSVNGDFVKPSQPKLILESTNIYDADIDGVFTGDFGADARFPVNGNIVLTFTEAIPEDAIVDIGLVSAWNSMVVAKEYVLPRTIAGKTITINPAIDLLNGKQYWLDISIRNEGEVIFNATELAYYDDLVDLDNTYITFTTVPNNNVAVLSSAASYGQTSSEFTFTGNAITGGTLKLGTAYTVMFDGPVTLTKPTTGLSAGLYDTTDADADIDVDIVASGQKLTITVKDATPATPYVSAGTIDLADPIGTINVAGFNITDITVTP
jgi:hypothetical protein